MSMTADPAGMDAFADRHVFNATSLDSSFARTVTAQRRDATGTTCPRARVLTRSEQGVVTTHTCERLDEWLDVLDDEFGLRLDAPRAELAALWTRVRRAHDDWTAARESA